MSQRKQYTAGIDRLMFRRIEAAVNGAKQGDPVKDYVSHVDELAALKFVVAHHPDFGTVAKNRKAVERETAARLRARLKAEEQAEHAAIGALQRGDGEAVKALAQSGDSEAIKALAEGRHHAD